jgi:hypothetical protein
MSRYNRSGDVILTATILAIIIIFFVFAAKAVAVVVNTVEFNREINDNHNKCIKFEHSGDCREFIGAIPQSTIRH